MAARGSGTGTANNTLPRKQHDPGGIKPSSHYCSRYDTGAQPHDVCLPLLAKNEIEATFPSPCESLGLNFCIVDLMCFIKERLQVLSFPTCSASPSPIDIGVCPLGI